MNDDGARNLVHAIIRQAVIDYKAALRGRKVGNVIGEATVAQCERFFRSGRFEQLTNGRIDGQMVIDRLRAEVRETKRKRHNEKGSK